MSGVQGVMEWVLDDKARRVRLIGELDYQYAQEVSDVIASSGVSVIDCAELTFLDAVGFRALVAAHRRALDEGRHLVFLRVNGAPLRVVKDFDADGELHIAP